MPTQDPSPASLQSPSQDWWKTFFKGLSVELWLAVPTDDWTRADADFVERTLAVPAGASLLDVPCGGGRHAHALAQRGYAVTGFDLSEQFLAHARGRPAPTRGSVELHQGDMRELPWSGAFDGAYSLGNSFAYMDDAGNEAYLRGVARALRPGARFVLESGVLLESILPNLEKRAWYAVGDIYSVIERRHDAASGTLLVDYTFLRAGETEKFTAVYRTYSLGELSRLVQRCGFEIESTLGSQDGQPYATGARVLYLVARKP